VRAKAFRLALRLNTDEVEKILLERADSMKGEVAADAIMPWKPATASGS
jgi:hypothetical protein